jgi:hypothetical protein
MFKAASVAMATMAITDITMLFKLIKFFILDFIMMGLYHIICYWIIKPNSSAHYITHEDVRTAIMENKGEIYIPDLTNFKSQQSKT